MSLHCPPGTSISVQQARYGRTPPHTSLCQGRLQQPPPQQQPQQPDGTDASNQVVPDNTTSCLWSEQLQYSLLQTVVEACQKKRLCQFQTAPRTFGNDPCPGVRKWVEVAYKCRPYEFRSKVACENEIVQLQCNPNSRIAVYSASYGRTEYESIQCPQPQRVPEETCLTSYATETVMNICHGKRACNIAADKDTFGSPCRADSRKYLKVVYTCVPRKVLKEEYEGRPEADESPDDVDSDYEGFDNTDEYRGGAASFSPAPKLHGEPPADNRSAPVLLSPGTRATPSAKAVADSENQEKLYLYLTLSISGGLLLFLGLVIGRLLVQRHRAKSEAKFRAANSAPDRIPNGFTDDISEIDADIDLSTPVAVPVVAIHSPPRHEPAEVVRYGTLRRGQTMGLGVAGGALGGGLSGGLGGAPVDLMEVPRSLNRGGGPNQQYYYG